MTVRFVIEPTGAVAKGASASSELADSSVTACLVQLYRLTCDDSDAEACTDLGVLLERSVAPPRWSEARAYYRKACDRGGANACAALGFLYDRGLSVAKDQARANQLYESACARGSEAGCNNLAMAYRSGEGKQKDLAARCSTKAIAGVKIVSRPPTRTTFE